ncbi:MAG: RdgB/HAM1 family non-canonical purine NTP pyrophosphatase [Oligoflexales bacterium]|nr:RdgB/HAM1 family non-canonical purine NTP pyrophosphatase [Oligoflexales bacterium]
MKLVIASYNHGKIQELQDLLLPKQLEVISLLDVSRKKIEWKEDGVNFSQNAAIKVDVVRKVTAYSILADDSGLIVPALGGQPGIFSSRYAGSNASDLENIDLLLQNMRLLSGERRKAFFVCCICYSRFGAQKDFFYGVLPGYISLSSRGSSGFGYDPIFMPLESRQTLAELSSVEKNKMSHRRRALDRFILQIKRIK